MTSRETNRRWYAHVPVVLAACLGTFFTSEPTSSAEVRPLVVGGSRVEEDAMPDVALVKLSGGLCSGVLVAPDLVLTAAHCLASGMKAESVRLGVRFVDQGDGEEIRVKSWEVYEKTDLRTSDLADGDVALLFLETPSARAPRLLASTCVVDRYLKVGTNVDVYGFGMQEGSTTAYAGELRTVSLPATEVTGGEIVARAEDQSACFGDSGGPVYVRTEVGTYLLALVSGGGDEDQRACVGINRYARVDALWSWIEAKAGRSLPRATCNFAPRAQLEKLRVTPGKAATARVVVADANPEDRFTFDILKQPARGTATVTEAGELHYTASGANGTDALTIAVHDNGVPAQTTEVSVDIEIESQAAGCSASGSRESRENTAAAPFAALGAMGLLAAVRRRRTRA